ncbi:MAG: preprotein translocase subunit SecG, partial [Thermodesulfobacteriota bacterium]
TIVHVIVAVILVITVLLQPGKGGDLGSMFGGGMSESIFGSSGAVPFLTKVTRVLAVLFIVTSLTLGYFSTKDYKSSVIKDIPSNQPIEESEVLPDEFGQGTTDVTSNEPGDKQEQSSTEDDSESNPQMQSSPEEQSKD